MPLDQLSLSALLPSSGREGVSLVFDYLLWLSTERGISVRTEGLVVGGLGWVEGCGWKGVFGWVWVKMIHQPEASWLGRARSSWVCCGGGLCLTLSCAFVCLQIRSAGAVAKFLYHSESQASAGSCSSVTSCGPGCRQMQRLGAHSMCALVCTHRPARVPVLGPCSSASAPRRPTLVAASAPTQTWR